MDHDLDKNSENNLLDGSWCYWDHSVRGASRNVCVANLSDDGYLPTVVCVL